MGKYDSLEGFCLTCHELKGFSGVPKVHQLESGSLQAIGQCAECGGRMTAFVRVHTGGRAATVKVSRRTKVAIEAMAERLQISQRQVLDRLVNSLAGVADWPVVEDGEEAEGFWDRADKGLIRRLLDLVHGR